MTEEVQRTAVNALTAKAGAAAKGYFGHHTTHQKWFDLMIKHDSATTKKVPRQSPLVHRAYFYRSAAIEKLVQRWLHETVKGRERQILVLGAGLDPLAFRILEAKAEDRELKVFEVDTDKITRKKVKALLRDPGSAQRVCGKSHKGENNVISETPFIWSCARYNAIAYDLRDICSEYSSSNSPQEQVLPSCTSLKSSAPGLESALRRAGFMYEQRDTLVLIECVLSYLPKPSADAILSWTASLGRENESNYVESRGDSGVNATKTGHRSTLILYEPLYSLAEKVYSSADIYAQQLCTHFQNRGCGLSPEEFQEYRSDASICDSSVLFSSSSLSSSSSYSSLDVPSSSSSRRSILNSAANRIRSCGWGSAIFKVDMNDAVELWLSKARDESVVQRKLSQTAKLAEPFDEHCALHAFQRRYGLFVATINSIQTESKSIDFLNSLLMPSVKNKENYNRCERDEVEEEDIKIKALVSSTKESTKLAREAAALVISTHETLAQNIPAVRRYFRNALRKDLSTPLDFYAPENSCFRRVRRLWVATSDDCISSTASTGVWQDVSVVGCIALCEAQSHGSSFLSKSSNSLEDSSSSNQVCSASSDQSGSSQEISAIGTASTSLYHLELRRLAVKSSFRGRGIGRRLLRAALDFCQCLADEINPAGIPIYLNLTVLDVPESLKALQLYKDAGFSMSSRAQDNNGEEKGTGPGETVFSKTDSPVPLLEMSCILRGKKEMTTTPRTNQNFAFSI